MTKYMVSLASLYKYNNITGNIMLGNDPRPPGMLLATLIIFIIIIIIIIIIILIIILLPTFCGKATVKTITHTAFLFSQLHLDWSEVVSS